MACVKTFLPTCHVCLLLFDRVIKCNSFLHIWFKKKTINRNQNKITYYIIAVFNMHCTPNESQRIVYHSLQWHSLLFGAVLQYFITFIILCIITTYSIHTWKVNAEKFNAVRFFLLWLFTFLFTPIAPVKQNKKIVVLRKNGQFKSISYVFKNWQTL